MKLTRRHGQTFHLELGRRERRVLVQALQLYPQLDVAHQRLTTAEKPGHHAGAEMLRREILSDHQRENRQCVSDFIAHGLGGPGEPPGQTPFPLAITRAQCDWLLEVLNDVRVGLWVRLGEPDEAGLMKLALSAESIALVTVMEYCGCFQSALLGLPAGAE
jgi:hypothetical protein